MKISQGKRFVAYFDLGANESADNGWFDPIKCLLILLSKSPLINIPRNLDFCSTLGKIFS